MAEAIAAQVDELVEKNAPVTETFTLLENALKEHPENVEILWRLARAYFDLADTKPDDKTWKQEKLTAGLKLAEKALQLDDKHYASHKWFAIMTSAIGDYLPTKEKIANAYKIKEHALKANELKPKDATTLHLLGRWCVGVASIGWMERKVASALFGTPPESSYDEALKFFLEAHEVNPTFRRNLLCIGDTYANLKQNPKAAEFYEKLVSLEATTPLEKSMQTEAKQKLSKVK